MTISRTLVSFWLLGLVAACGGPGDSAAVPEARTAGPNSADIGNHIVYFNAQSTDQLSEEVADAYQILRSSTRAMLNVSIVRKSDGQPVAGTVDVTTVNLTGQLKNVTMRKFEEPGETVAIYYIGETAVSNRETLIFDITVTPEGEQQASEVRFKRQFYTDT